MSSGVEIFTSSEALLALLITGATLGLAIALIRAANKLDPLRQTLMRAEARRSESLRLQQAEQRIAEIQRLAECAIAGSADLVQAMHKGIAAVPFGVLEIIPATRDTARVVRKAHDLISGAVYGSIGAVNRGVGSTLRESLHAVSEPDVSDVSPPSGRAAPDPQNPKKSAR